MAYLRILSRPRGLAALLLAVSLAAGAGCTEPNPNYQPDPPPPPVKDAGASSEVRVGCGDGTCGAGESCTSCPQDCGQCPHCGDGSCNNGETAATCPQDCGVRCGDGRCEGDETPASCPKDCSVLDRCGNGACEPPETATTCPKDCAPTGCPEGETRCKGDGVLETCKSGVWTTSICLDACKAAGYDTSSGCQPSPKGSGFVCACEERGRFGSPCQTSAKCEKGLVCVSFGGAPWGFCTKFCNAVGSTCSGAPPNTSAECDASKVNNKHVCIFSCDLQIGCPTGLTCSNLFDGRCEP